MEADWEVEIGPDSPVIEACWPGYVDLRHEPDRARLLPEAAQLPALAATLAQLNSADSPVWTSKCDVWPLTGPDEFDPDELDAPEGSAEAAIGCYIDLLPRSDGQWLSPADAVRWCKHRCALLHGVPLRSCRVDFVVRRALLAPGEWNHGITAYFTACGPSAGERREVIEQALAAFALCLEQPFKATMDIVGE